MKSEKVRVERDRKTLSIYVAFWAFDFRLLKKRKKTQKLEIFFVISDKLSSIFRLSTRFMTCLLENQTMMHLHFHGKFPFIVIHLHSAHNSERLVIANKTFRSIA